MYICHSFSKKETHTEAVVYYMENWGLSVPCNEDIYFLESDYAELQDIIEGEGSVLIVLTQYLGTDTEALVELDIIRKLFIDGKVRVFTFCYDVDLEELPCRMEWLKNTEMLPINGTDSLYQAICIIIDAHLNEDIKQTGSMGSCRRMAGERIREDRYISELFKEYEGLEKYAVKTKIVVLYTIYRYISVTYTIKRENSFYANCITHVFEELDCQEQCGTLQVRIVERSLLLLILRNF